MLLFQGVVFWGWVLVGLLVFSGVLGFLGLCVDRISCLAYDGYNMLFLRGINALLSFP
jgi:hypothetical protein